jgi:hypothetical protein
MGLGEGEGILEAATVLQKWALMVSFSEEL